MVTGAAGFCVSFLNACAPLGMAQVESYSSLRVRAVEPNTTIYTSSLSCMGEKLRALQNSGQVNVENLVFAVGGIQDRTGATGKGGGSPLTQGAAHMLMNALSTLNAFTVREYVEFHPINLRRHLQPGEQSGNAFMPNIGSLLPSNFYIAGAITEYSADMRSRSMNASLFTIGYNGRDHVISVGLDLRLIDSSRGVVIRDAGMGAVATSLKNSVVAREYEGDFFRIVGGDTLGLSYGIKITDPTHLAVRELVEAGTLDLIGKFFDIPWQTECPIQFPTRAEIRDNRSKELPWSRLKMPKQEKPKEDPKAEPDAFVEVYKNWPGDPDDI